MLVGRQLPGCEPGDEERYSRGVYVELLRARGVTTYRSAAKDSAHLFDDLELTLSEGDRLALIGPNGSGKSTLLKLLAGVSQPTDGSIVRAPGIRVALLEQAAGAALGAAPAGAALGAAPSAAAYAAAYAAAGAAAGAAPGTTAAGTVWQVASRGLSDLEQVERRLMLEERRIAAGLQRSEQHQALLAEFASLGGYAARALVREILAALGFPPTTHDQRSDLLSSGQRQRLALAAVLSSQADVLLLDEPTNHLDLEARIWLERHLARRRGSLVLISHDRDLLTTVTTGTATLRGGKLLLESGGHGRRRAWRRRKPRQRRSSKQPPVSAAGAVQAQVERRVRGRLLGAERLSLPGVFDDVALRIDANDRIALIGANGSGKSSLLAQLAGDLPSADPRAELQYAPGLKLVWVPQDTRGLDPQLTLIEQTLGLLGEGAAQRTLADAGIWHESWGRRPHELSGGERARAGLALAMARDFDLLLLDEPDNDLDLSGLEQFEEALHKRLEATSAALLMVTHDRRLASNIAGRAWTLSDDGLMAFTSVRAYLRGDEPVRAELFWQEPRLTSDGQPGASGPTRNEQGGRSARALDELAKDLEEERNTLLTSLFDPLALSERDLERNERRLQEVEELLMTLYDERFEPTTPSRRFVERGLEIYAERLADDRWAMLAAADPNTARRLLQRPGAGGEAWLELRVVAGVANIRLHQPSEACLLSWAAGALLEAAVRLVFAVLDARTAQYFHSDAPGDPTAALHGTNFSPLVDGWWLLTLEDFLAQEGWQVT